MSDYVPLLRDISDVLALYIPDAGPPLDVPPLRSAVHPLQRISRRISVLAPPRNSLQDQFVKALFTAMNTKGFAVLAILFLFRYPAFATLSKKFGILCCVAFAICANFNLDLDSKVRKKSLTVGISRALLVGVCYMICKRCDIGTAPLVCGLAIRTLPVSMFFIFKTIYQILSAIAQHFEVKSETSSAVGEQEEAERIDEGAQCCICLDFKCDFKTSCGHCFHAACLSKWLEVKSFCPLCNKGIDCKNKLTGGLQNYFVLDYSEWKEMHSFLCGDWWGEAIISTRPNT